jgi:hypothetical protein
MPDDEGEFFGNELSAALVAARPQSRQGEFLSASVGAVLTARIDRALLRGIAVAPARAYEPLPGEPAPVVRGEVPAVAGSVTRPALFAELPALPPHLDFVLWGRDLVLVDRLANLVLDVLPDALPDSAYPGVVYQ